MAAKVKLADDESYVEGRSSAKAKALLEKAAEAGLEGRVVTTAFGYIVPTGILGDGEATSGTHSNVLRDGTVAAQAEPGVRPEAAEEFDPSKASVAEVNEYLAGADDIERERVLAAEQNGKARKGIRADTEGE
jgi:hypothetical protein